MKESFERKKILGVHVNKISLSEFLDEMFFSIQRAEKTIISNVNVHALNIAYKNTSFRDFINSSSLVFCDGFGIMLAARLTGQKLYARFTPPDFIDKIAELAHQSHWKIFFLGAKSGIAKDAAEKLEKKYKGLQIETYHGYFDKTHGCDENTQVVKLINDFGPQLLVVGFGMPLQEKWVLENFDNLQINIAFPAGALFDYMAGSVKRAPKWMTDNGFEWLGRLLVEPKRLWKRYIIGNPLFFWRVFVHHVLKFPLPYQE